MGHVSYPKPAPPVRSEPYRRLVASLSCINCGISGSSQAAHPNTGKAKGRKADDRLCFPLCHVGANGCHRKFDEYRLFSGGADLVAIEAGWAQRTQQTLRRIAKLDAAAARVIASVLGDSA